MQVMHEYDIRKVRVELDKKIHPSLHYDIFQNYLDDIDLPLIHKASKMIFKQEQETRGCHPITGKLYKYQVKSARIIFDLVLPPLLEVQYRDVSMIIPFDIDAKDYEVEIVIDKQGNEIKKRKYDPRILTRSLPKPERFRIFDLPPVGFINE